MQISDNTFDSLARLAHLQFTTEEREKMKHDLSQILNWVEQLQEVDVSGVDPQRHMSSLNNLQRKDIAAAPLNNTDALKPAAQSEAPFFSVPKFIVRES